MINEVLFAYNNKKNISDKITDEFFFLLLFSRIERWLLLWWNLNNLHSASSRRPLIQKKKG